MPDSFDWRSEIRARLNSLSSPRPDGADEADIIDEIAQHLDDQTADLMARGASQADAWAALLARLDDPQSNLSSVVLARQRSTRIRESSPIGAPLTVSGALAALWRDAKYGARSLARTPSLTAVIVLSLGLVIGANTAIFGLLDSVLLRRLPIPHAEELVSLRPMSGGTGVTFPYANYKTLTAIPGLPKIEAYRPQAGSVGAHGDQTDMWVELVTGGYFDLLGVPPMLGRTISRSDESNSVPVVVVSEDYWREHLGGDRAVLGKPVTINSIPFTLIGVMPRSFGGIFFAHRFTVAIPVTAAALYDDRALTQYNIALVTRLPTGEARRAVAARLSTVFVRCCLASAPMSSSARADRVQPQSIPDDPPMSAFGAWRDTLDATPHVQVLDASRGITWSVDFRGQYEHVLMALMAGVLLLLVIACANVGTLLLARAAARQREFAVRMSLGASRNRILRQLLTESLELTVAGSVVGLVFAWLGTTLLLHSLPGNALQLGDVIAWRVSPMILGFTVLVTLVCTVVAGIWPARRASRADILAPLTGADRVNARARGWPVDRGLAVAQMSLALVLVTAAALFVETLRNLQRADGGYHSRSVLLARVSEDSIGRAAQTIVDQLARLPGVDAAGASYAAPVINDALFWQQIEVPGRPTLPGENSPEANAVTPGYFAATGIGVSAGREFDVHDDTTSEPVAIVSEAFARRYFAHRNPIGLSLIVQFHARQTLRIVGVAHDARYRDLHGQPSEMWYMPVSQWNGFTRPARSIAIAVRTDVDPVSLASLVRRTIVATAPAARIRTIASVGQLLDDGLAKERFAAGLAALFGAVALGLAIIGVYGVIAYSVARRTPEIGIRMALGATPRDALGLVMRQTMLMAATGVAIGVPLAYAASRAVASQLFDVGAGDWRVMIGTAAALMAAGLAAGVIPGRRAARVDPLAALRSDWQ